MLLFLSLFFLPLLGLSITVWFGIRKRPEYGRRAVLLRNANLVLILQAAFTLSFNILASDSIVIQASYLMISLYLFCLAMILLEYSVHYQRIHFSYLTEEVKPGLRSLTIFMLIPIPFIALYTYKAFAGKWNIDKNGGLPIVMIVLTLLLLVNILMMAKVFVFKKGVLRKRLYPFAFQIPLLLVFLGAFFFLSSFKTLPLILLFVFYLLFAIRIYEEYLHHRTKHMGRLLKKQEVQRANSTALINQIIVCESKEDSKIIANLIEQTVEYMSHELINNNYGISGIATYRFMEGSYIVDSLDYFYGFCTPLKKVGNIKKLRKESIHRMLIDSRYNKKYLLNTDEMDLPEFGDVYVKRMLMTKEIQFINPIPEIYKGLQKLIALVPIVNNNEVSGFQVIYKDRYENLYPHEKNALISLGFDLNTLFSIHYGKYVQDEKNRLAGEMDIAKQIQTSIVPSTIKLEGYTIACNMETATEVGGDAYDYILSEYGNYFGIGDVSGHGLPSGIMALIFVTAFQSIIETAGEVKKELAADVVYNIINRVLCRINTERIGSDKFMTGNIFLEKKGTFSHAGAHEIAVQYCKKLDKVIEHHGCSENTAFLGLSDKINANTSLGDFSLESGDVLILYTDGLIEAKDEDSLQYGMDKLDEILMREKDNDPDTILENIMDSIYEHAKNGDMKRYKGNLADDVSILIIRKD